HLGERCACLCGQPLVNVVLVNPVANFTRPYTHAGMQTSAPEYLGFLTIEDAISKILAQIKRTTALAEALDLSVEVFGLVLGPPHPRTQMLQVRNLFNKMGRN